MSSFVSKFWSKLEKRAGCWLWKGEKNYHGYGVTDTGELAHFMSWQIHHGYIPKGRVDVFHNCGNNSCVNPDHLFLGEKVKKVPVVRVPRVKRPRPPLNWDVVNEIRSNPQISVVEFSEKLGVSFGEIYFIRNNMSWKE